MIESSNVLLGAVFLSVLLLLVMDSNSETTLNPSYTASVVEYAPYSVTGEVSREVAVKVIHVNLDAYTSYVIAASKAGEVGPADIIVFPEDGLYGDSHCTREEIYPYLEAVPDPSTAGRQTTQSSPIIPCDEPSVYEVSSPIIYNISCMARTYGLTIVLDMGEMEQCNTTTNILCPTDGRFQYNTQVAFSDTGELLAKYRKNHLFYEPQYNSNPDPQPVTFRSSFGVTFGMFICFDMMFGTPAAEYSRDLDVHDIVYSTWWINTPPYFSATQVQQAWSSAMQSNLLAAGNGVSYLFSGSGIYSNGTVLASNYDIYDQPDGKLLMAVVPILSVDKKSEEIRDGGTEDGDITDNLATVAALPAREPITADAPLWEVIGLHSDAPMFLHCPPNNATSSEKRNDHIINSAGASDTVQKRSTVFTHGIDIAEPIGYTIPNLTMTPFTITPGLLQNVTASVGEFVCNAQVKPSLYQPHYIDGYDTYVLMAFAGQFDNVTDFYHEQFCAVFRCVDPTDCLSLFVFEATVLFDEIRLSGHPFHPNTTMFKMASTNDVMLFPEAPLPSPCLAADGDSNGMTVGCESAAIEDGVVLSLSMIGRVL